MAISPGIPTSFVPHQQAPGTQRPQSSGNNLFLIASLFIGGLVVIAAIGTFAYEKYLAHVIDTKSQELSTAESQVNDDQVEHFVRLRDRLTYGKDLLNNHVVISQVFDLLEQQTLATVRFSSLSITVADDHTAQLEVEGTARTFNALAAQSNAFAAEKNIRRAIFSGITVNKDNTVSFKMTADLDSKLLLSNTNVFGTPQPTDGSQPAAQPAPAQSSTTTPSP